MLAALTTKRGHVDFRTSAASAHAPSFKPMRLTSGPATPGLPIRWRPTMLHRPNEQRRFDRASVGKIGVIYDSLSPNSRPDSPMTDHRGRF